MKFTRVEGKIQEELKNVTPEEAAAYIHREAEKAGKEF
jgi:hypothetical protein